MSVYLQNYLAYVGVPPRLILTMSVPPRLIPDYVVVRDNLWIKATYVELIPYLSDAFDSEIKATEIELTSCRDFAFVLQLCLRPSTRSSSLFFRIPSSCPYFSSSLSPLLASISHT